MTDPRLDSGVSKLTRLIVKIVREQCPINHGGILKQLPSNVLSEVLSTRLKKLRDYGILRMEKKGHSGFMWVYLPPQPDIPVIFRDVGEGKKKIRDGTKAPHVLRDMGFYRIRTADGVQHDRITFQRATMTWKGRTKVYALDEVRQVSFIPDHVVFRSGTNHLNKDSYPWIDLSDCIVPKLKPSDDTTPGWIHPIRARVLGLPVAVRVDSDMSPDKDPSNPVR
jgi:hypothetical protein